MIKFILIVLMFLVLSCLLVLDVFYRKDASGYETKAEKARRKRLERRRLQHPNIIYEDRDLLARLKREVRKDNQKLKKELSNGK